MGTPLIKRTRFCPFCGVVDRLTGDGTSGKGPEFICTICFSGFRIEASRRVEKVNYLIHQERKQRPSNSDNKKEEFDAIVKRKHRQINHSMENERRRKVTDKMREWLSSEECRKLSEHYGIKIDGRTDLVGEVPLQEEHISGE